jgi:hypothetical protein
MTYGTCVEIAISIYDYQHMGCYVMYSGIWVTVSTESAAAIIRAEDGDRMFL